MTPLPSAAPTIQTRQHLDVVVENIVHLQRDRDELACAQEKEIAAIREKYRASLAELERYLLLEKSWVENWARENRGAFAANRTLDCAHATIGFISTPPRIERASRRWTWSRIAQCLSEVAWGRRYLRQPAPEVDKEALVANLATLSPVDLRAAGIKIIQGERFQITPREEAENTVSWQEAA